MEEGATRVRVRIGDGEIEIQGSEGFVRDQLEEFDYILQLLKARVPATPLPDVGAVVGAAPAEAASQEEFGAYLQRFPATISDQDRVLIAALWAQRRDPDDSFATSDANRLLIDQGIKVANASTAVRRHKKAKRLFAVEAGRHRVSQGGIDYINSLMEG